MSDDKSKTAVEKLAAFRHDLENDTVMEISIGDNKPLRISYSILTSISEYFVKAIQHQSVGGCQSRTLSFPEDTSDPWTILLWWATRGEVPAAREGIQAGEEATPYFQAWILGDKYDIPKLQNAVMFELLIYLERGTLQDKHTKLTFQNTMPGSQLRKLVVEDLAYELRRGAVDFEYFTMLDGADGAIADVLKGLSVYDTYKGKNFLGNRLKYRWREFMVEGDGVHFEWAARYH